MTVREVFVKAVAKSGCLPEEIRIEADAFVEVEEHTITASYLAFLDEQIDLEPRGPEWSAVLRTRKGALEPFRGQSLIRGHLFKTAIIHYVEVCPRSLKVVLFESSELLKT